MNTRKYIIWTQRVSDWSQLSHLIGCSLLRFPLTFWLALGESQKTMPSSELWKRQKAVSLSWSLCPTVNRPNNILGKKKRRTFFRNSSATIRALALTDSFISLISLSISSMKWMTKSTSLCLYICSVWKLVIKKLISYPCEDRRGVKIGTQNKNKRIKLIHLPSAA